MEVRDMLALAASVVIALITQIVTPWSAIWWGGMVFSCVIAVASLGHIVWKGGKYRIVTNVFSLISNHPGYIPIIVLIFAALVLISVYFSFKISPIEQMKHRWREEIEKKEQLGPLFNYYQTDMFGTLNLDATLEISVTDYKQAVITVPYSLFFQIDANIYIASIYIPPIDNINTINYVINQLASRHAASFKAILQTVHLSASPPGESNWLSDGAKFSGRIYVYYDNIVSPDDLARWRLMFSQDGADAEFRGQQYLQYKASSKP